MAKSAPKKTQPAKRAGKSTTAPRRSTVGKTATSGKKAKATTKPAKQSPPTKPVLKRSAVKAVASRKPEPPAKGRAVPAARRPAVKAATAKSASKSPTAVKPVIASKAKSPKPMVAVKPFVTPKSTPAVKPVVAAKVTAPVAVRPVVVPIATPVPPVAKPKRNPSGLGVRDLQHFADLLLVKRREIVGDMHSMEGEALRSGTSGLSTLPVHMADMGTDNYEQEFTLGLVEKDRNLLREINHALAKIPAGTYGICEGTGEPIGKPRLEVQPWARHSIEYARLRERNGRGVRMF